MKKENLIALVLNLKDDWEKSMEKFCTILDNLFNTVDNLSTQLDQVELSFVVTKIVNNNLLNWIASFERSLYAQEQYNRAECLEVVGIPTSVDDKNLQVTVWKFQEQNRYSLWARKSWRLSQNQRWPYYRQV